MNRRAFFKVSAAAALALGIGGVAYKTFAPTAVPVVGAAFLDQNARAALRAIIPTMLGPVFSAEPTVKAREVEATIARIDAGILGLSAAAQKEVGELFMLLGFTPARWALTGISDWANASEADIATFLQKWRTHRLGLLQVAYHALHDLIGGSHYSDPSTWQRIGFSLPVSFKDL